MRYYPRKSTPGSFGNFGAFIVICLIVFIGTPIWSFLSNTWSKTFPSIEQQCTDYWFKGAILDHSYREQHSDKVYIRYVLERASDRRWDKRQYAMCVVRNDKIDIKATEAYLASETEKYLKECEIRAETRKVRGGRGMKWDPIVSPTPAQKEAWRSHYCTRDMGLQRIKTARELQVYGDGLYDNY